MNNPTMKDVLFEIFNQPMKSWPTNFTDFLHNLTYEQWCNTHGFNVAETEDDYRYYAKQTLEIYCEWLEEAGLLTAYWNEHPRWINKAY